MAREICQEVGGGDRLAQGEATIAQYVVESNCCAIVLVESQPIENAFSGKTFIRLAQYDIALENLQAALAIFREIEVPKAEAEAIANLAQLHQETGKLEQARKYCDAALQLATKLGIPLVEDCQKLKEELEAGGE